uniref:HTH psq-type domain-containing protein n=1 Tax=Elaeophora elaphi TaxID=1147741 RepID=A0A0R3S2Y9_9BILA
MAVDSSTPTTTTTERRKKKPYKELTLEEKVQLIRLAEENAGMSQASIAERYSIAKSNVCRILQRKHEYLRAYEWAGFAGSRKRKLRGDPQHHHSQQQQSRGNARDFNNFQTFKMANTTNIVSHNHSTNYVELSTSSSTERTTDDNHLIVPQRPTTIIHQRGNVIYIYFDDFSLV